MKVLTAGYPENVEPMTGSFLVELSVVAPFGQDQLMEDMRNFSEQLKPYPACIYNLRQYLFNSLLEYLESDLAAL